MEAESEHVDVELDLDLDRGLTAAAGDVTVRMSGVLDRRVFAAAPVTLGGVDYALANVYAPCATAEVTVAGTPVAGAPEVDDAAAPPSSTAFLAVAEVWSRTP